MNNNKIYRILGRRGKVFVVIVSAGIFDEVMTVVVFVIASGTENEVGVVLCDIREHSDGIDVHSVLNEIKRTVELVFVILAHQNESGRQTVQIEDVPVGAVIEILRQRIGDGIDIIALNCAFTCVAYSETFHRFRYCRVGFGKLQKFFSTVCLKEDTEYHIRLVVIGGNMLPVEEGLFGRFVDECLSVRRVVSFGFQKVIAHFLEFLIGNGAHRVAAVDVHIVVLADLFERHIRLGN